MAALSHLRPYAASDEDAAIALWLATWKQAYPAIDFDARVDWWRKRWREELLPVAQVVIAQVDDEMAGFVTIDASGYLDQLVVGPAHQGSPVATALVDEAKRLSPDGVTLKVNADNARAIRFYERNGFLDVGEDFNPGSKRPVRKMVWKPPLTIRDATINDAAHACEVMRRSIRELCAADHKNDPDILTAWLGNKQTGIVETWIIRQDNSVMLALLADVIVAVGSVTDAGEIQLNYVSPDARFCGVSSAMLEALEKRALQRSVSTVRLVSTETAHSFYQKRGYVDDAAPEGRFGTDSSYPMFKSLSDTHTP